MSVSQTTGMDSSDTTTRGADDESIAWDADNLASGFVAEVEINDLAAGFEINSTSSVPSDHSVQSATSPPCVDNPSDLSDGVMIMTGNDPESFDFDSGKDLICSQIALDSSKFRAAVHCATKHER